MDFKDLIKQIAERADKLRNSLQTEEATKNALIMPFIQALGYDVFNPLEVVPEMTCDIGTKKGEKIDYAIFRDGVPIILIECKHWAQNLSLHDNQLLRYFHAAKVKFGILTNGITYRFYTDLDEPNRMDEKPFLEVSMLDLKEAHIEELKKFHKSYFDVHNILSSASELKYTSELKALLAQEFNAPASEFVKYFAKRIYEGVITPKLLEIFTELTKKTLQSFINDRITDRFKSAIETQEKAVAEIEATEAAPVEKSLPDGVVYMSEDGSVVTTQEEIEAFYIVRAILYPHIGAGRITYRDAHSYFAIFLDDNNRKPVCRLYLNSASNKRLTFIDENKKEVHNKISSIDDIYNHSEQLIEAIKKYL
jgi:hypothetical protein